MGPFDIDLTTIMDKAYEKNQQQAARFDTYEDYLRAVGESRALPEDEYRWAREFIKNP